MPIYYISILIVFALWLQYEIRKNNRLSKKKTEEFWKKEQASNLARRTDISELDYITIHYEVLPLADHEDDTINSYRNIILNLSDKKILNLTGITNTDLKLRFGAANITSLMEYDNNYTILVSMLHKWGEHLYTLGFQTEACSVLEYAVTCHTDVKKTYRLLSQIYEEQNTPDKLNWLIQTLTDNNVLQKVELADELLKSKNS